MTAANPIPTPDQGVRVFVSSTLPVTLTGPGGVGKTRLAVETASRASAGFADGARFADLAAVLAAELVPTVAGALGLSTSGPT